MMSTFMMFGPQCHHRYLEALVARDHAQRTSSRSTLKMLRSTFVANIEIRENVTMIRSSQFNETDVFEDELEREDDLHEDVEVLVDISIAIVGERILDGE